jgi:heat shock protein HslJ
VKTHTFLCYVTVLILLGLSVAGCTQSTSLPTSTPIADGPTSPTQALIGPPAPGQLSPTAVGAAPTLENTPWVLRDFANDGLKPLLAVFSVTLQLNPVDGIASGVSACNHYSGAYTLNGDSLNFASIATTMMACTELPGAVESAYQPVLEQVASYRLSGNSLLLLDSNQKTLLRFEVDPFAQTSQFTRQELANATYRSPFTGGGTIKLTDGFYDDAKSAGTVALSNYAAFGDVTGDGQEDAAVMLVVTMNTDVFYSLTVVQHVGDHLSDAQILVGNQVRLNNLQIAGEQIVLVMLIPGPDDPVCCPSIQTTQRYGWVGTQLELLDSLESR